jgi:hypothetical protein
MIHRAQTSGKAGVTDVQQRGRGVERRSRVEAEAEYIAALLQLVMAAGSLFLGPASVRLLLPPVVRDWFASLHFLLIARSSCWWLVARHGVGSAAHSHGGRGAGVYTGRVFH